MRPQMLRLFAARLLVMQNSASSQRVPESLGPSINVEFDALRKRELAGVVNRTRGATHVGLPGI
mgnify:CR=1 FL=1